MHPNSPINPCQLENNNDEEIITGYEGADLHPGYTENYRGLTMRQHFAGLAMQSLIAKVSFDRMAETYQDVAYSAACYADALIEQLTVDENHEEDEHGLDDPDADGLEPEPSGAGAEDEGPEADELPVHFPV